MTSTKTWMATVSAALVFIACSEEKTLPETTMTVIDNTGGLAKSADGKLELRFPTGAVGESTEITVTTKRETFPRAKSFIYDFGPDGIEFSRNVMITFSGLTSDEELTIAQIDGNNAYVLEDAVWDPAAGTVTASLEHFSSYAVITVYTPCGNKACGDTCVICDPLDPTCTEPPPANKACNQSGLCVDATLPMCNPPPRDGGVVTPPDAGTPDSGVTPDAGVTPDGGTPACVDSFTQRPQPLVDVLLVVDNSCSMAEEQATLAGNFNLLLDTLVQNNTDFHIGVTTTDTSQTGERGHLVGNVPVLNPNTPSLAAEYASNVMVGTFGDAIEKGLEGMSLSLTASTASAFHRGGASLTVIIASDEEDASPNAAQDHVDAMHLAKGLYAERRVQINTITGGTQGCSGMNGNASAEARYEDARAQTYGAHSAVCTAPYNQALTDLGGADYGYEFLFSLTQSPSNAQAITVTVDGVPAASGWTHDATNNAIVFAEGAVPGPNAAIDVTYDCN